MMNVRLLAAVAVLLLGSNLARAQVPPKATDQAYLAATPIENLQARLVSQYAQPEEVPVPPAPFADNPQPSIGIGWARSSTIRLAIGNKTTRI